MEARSIICIASLLLLTALSQGAGDGNYIPITGGDNYYSFYGGPSIRASISGTNEFQRGDTVTLYIDLTNYGRIIGFKQDKTPNNPTEYALANAEQNEEKKKTTALGIVGTLISKTSEIEVKSGDQIVESLQAGDKTKEPMKFTIKIAKHAPAGEYPLTLNLSYDYQSNVAVYAANLEQIQGLPPVFVNGQWSYYYQKGTERLTVPIVVKQAANFAITDIKGSLRAGEKKAEIEVTYKNTGEDRVTDAIARLSIFKPFSSTDDQAYIGSLEPGEERTVKFRIDADSDSTPKDYGINSEIKYSDIRGDTVISESMKIPITVYPAGRSMMLPALAVVAMLVILGGYLYRRRQKKD